MHGFVVGGYINVETGRRDAIVSIKFKADEQLPTVDITVDDFINVFHPKNIKIQEVVALK